MFPGMEQTSQSIELAIVRERSRTLAVRYSRMSARTASPTLKKGYQVLSASCATMADSLDGVDIR